MNNDPFSNRIIQSLGRAVRASKVDLMLVGPSSMEDELCDRLAARLQAGNLPVLIVTDESENVKGVDEILKGLTKTKRLVI